MLHIGLLHHLEELARIGRQALDIPALPLGIDGVEGEAGFAAARQAGDNDQAVARQIDIDALEVVLTRAAHRNMGETHGGVCSRFVLIAQEGVRVWHRRKYGVVQKTVIWRFHPIQAMASGIAFHPSLGKGWRSMPNWKSIVGLSFGQAEFDSYCKGLNWSAWRPSFIVIHNTAIPSLAQRPNGFTRQHIRNLEAYYKSLGWRAGPHLFVDDKQIWVFTPLTTTGRNVAIGVEMLGNFETEAFNAGRGLKVRRNAVAAVASISRRLGLDPATIRLHKEDPATSHDCPGKNVKKADFIGDVRLEIASYYEADHDPADPHPDD